MLALLNEGHLLLWQSNFAKLQFHFLRRRLAMIDKLGKKITLPPRDEMLQRLLKMNDNNHFQERFYPKLLREAGSEKVAIGVVMLLQLAIHDYTTGMPASMDAVMNMMMPDLIDALCPDEEVAKEAKAFFERAMAAR